MQSQSAQAPVAQTAPIQPPAPVQIEVAAIPQPAELPPVPPPASGQSMDVEPDLIVRPFRECDERGGATRWWEATGQLVISEPPTNLRVPVELGDLYVYKAKLTDRIYTWVYRQATL